MLLIVLAIPLVLLLLCLFWAQRIFNGIERVEVSPVLSSGNGTNYLIVGSDTREGTPPDPNAEALGITEPPGQRADTIMLLHFGSGGTRITSIPRDLWVTNPATGSVGKINATYNPDLCGDGGCGGPSNLIQTVTNELGIPIDRYMEVDFVSFSGVVDAVGGITIDFEHPASDSMTGLNITEAGPHHLNGEQALAYVRSRHYVEVIDGQQVPDPQADLGRVERQQKFLSALFAKLGGSRNPLTLLRSFEEVGKGLRIDDAMSFGDAIRLGWRMRGFSPELSPIPVVNDGGGLALEPGAEEVLDQFK